MHTNDRPFPCPLTVICKQSFKTRSQLSDHILKHTHVKKHICPECKASFSRKSRLKIHLMIHKGEKPFECEICNKRFREKSNYNFHMKKHKEILNKNNKENNNKNMTNNIPVMDTNINSFCLDKNNKDTRKSSDINNSTQSNTNNSFEKLLEEDKNDNLFGIKDSTIFKLLNINNNNSLDFNVNNMKNPIIINEPSDFLKDSFFKNMDEPSINHELNLKKNEGIFSFTNTEPLNKNNYQIKKEEELYNIKEEKEITNEINYLNSNDLSFFNDDSENLSINEALNQKLNLKEFNNNLFSCDFNLNFETKLLKQNFN